MKLLLGLTLLFFGYCEGGGPSKTVIPDWAKCHPSVNTNCHTFKGQCLKKSWTSHCEYTLDTACAPNTGCTCCVDCDETKPSACRTTGGTCKKTCPSGKYYDSSTACFTNLCKCCKTCVKQPECQGAEGYCIDKAGSCNSGYYKSTGCGPSSNCRCCKKNRYCTRHQSCKDDNGYCTRGLCKKFHKRTKEGCSGPECYCCRPSSSLKPETGGNEDIELPGK